MKILVLCFLFAGCTVYHYPPTTITVRDSYNTYAPVYAPTSASTQAQIYTTGSITQPVYAPYNKVKKVKKVKKYRGGQW